MKNPHDVLGVPCGATDEEVKKAYRALALEWHPDRHGGDPAAEERFKEINAAYQALQNPQPQQKQQPRSPGFVNLDFMDSFFFGAAFGQTRQWRRSGVSQITVPVSLEDVHAGCRKKVSINRRSACGACGGCGRSKGSGSCQVCGGSGQRSVRVGISPLNIIATCPTCSGSGRSGPKCSACDGRGWQQTTDEVDLDIQAGTPHGHVFTRGDVRLVVAHAPHSEFSKIGAYGIGSTIEVDALDAILGATILVKTLAGRMSMKIPPGTQHGARLRIAGAGLKRREGGSGDHVVLIHLKTTRLDEDQHCALGKLRDSWRGKEGSRNEDTEE